MATYLAPQPWHGREDGDDLLAQRWHQAVQLLDLSDELIPGPVARGVVLLGFCCDEGVRRNKGRTGAREAPFYIRRACADFAVHFSHIGLADAGDVLCNDTHLEAAQALLAQKISILIQAGYTPVVMGGGHEVAFASFCGIYPGNRRSAHLGVINFDAHLDLQAINPVIGACSGTSFLQMAERVKTDKNNFEYLVIGLQQSVNTSRLFCQAAELEAMYVLAEDCNNEQQEHIMHLINGVLYQSSLVQLSIDMDVFNAAVAPGVSAPAVNGILPGTMFKKLIRHILQSGKVCALDIAETNPAFDIDNRTSRLAASFIYDALLALDEIAATSKY